MPKLINIGLNHNTAPIEVRESFAFTESQKKEIMKSLLGKTHARGVVILITCNRCEIYLITEDTEYGEEQLKSILDQHSHIEGIDEYLYFYEGKESILHLFEVASGLDSMVKGEPQILGQVKEAYQLSCDENSCDVYMHEIFKRGIRAGKRARDETEISKKCVSVGSAVCELAEDKLADLKKANVLIIGAGDMGQLILKNLLSRGISNPSISNRTMERTMALIDKFQGTAIPMDELRENIADFDLIISSTSASKPVLKKEIYGDKLAEKEDEMMIIDIAVPRDIGPELSDIDGVHIYDIDDLDKIIEDNMIGGEAELDRVGDIIKTEYELLQNWFDHREAVPLIKALNEKAEMIREKELQKAAAKLSHIDDHEVEKEVLDDFSRALVQKILHEPIVNLKRLVEDDEEDKFDIISELFDLEV